MNTARRIATAATAVNIVSMFLGASTADGKALAAGAIGSAVSIYGWLMFQEEAELMGVTDVKYTHLAMRLRWEIKEESMPPGTRLPTTRQLADTHHVHRKVVIKALKILAEEKLIITLPGRGSYVAGGSRTDKPKDALEWHLLSTTKPGQPLPKTTEICQRTGISASTIRRVLTDLLGRGVLYRSGKQIRRR
jgi:GntR family transcriptional regulator